MSDILLQHPSGVTVTEYVGPKPGFKAGSEPN